MAEAAHNVPIAPAPHAAMAFALSLRLARLRARFGPWVLAGCLGSVAPAVRAEPPALQACFDADVKSVHRFQDAQGRWRGAAMDLTQLALQRAGLQVQWHALPWARCLRAVSDAHAPGKEGMDLLMFASRNPGRDQAMWVSRALHADEGGVWYSRTHFPQGLPLGSRADLKRFKLCGLNGGNFQWLAEWDVAGVDFKPFSPQSALWMVERGHCDLFLFAQQPVQGAARQGLLQLPSTLAFQPYPDALMVTQHLMLSRRHPQSKAWLRRLDAALAELERSGEADRLYRRYGLTGTGLTPGPVPASEGRR